MLLLRSDALHCCCTVLHCLAACLLLLLGWSGGTVGG